MFATPSASSTASTSSDRATIEVEDIQQSRDGHLLQSHFAPTEIRLNASKAEVIWTLKSLFNHLSYRSSDGIKDVFSAMFPDSDIAKTVSLGRTKMRYIAVHGLAPHFRKMLTNRLSQCDALCICFDEALNKISQRGQMDLHVRFWDEANNCVATRFLTSVFMGHATAKDLYDSFMLGTKTIDLNKVAQISMDGPNVNWKFYRELKGYLNQQASHSSLIDTGSCGLHVVSGAFQTGNRENWNINSFLRHLYWLFKDCPARRATYTNLTSSCLWPLKFCQVRWLENSGVVARAIEMLPFIRIWVEKVTPKPRNAAFDLVRNCVTQDVLFQAKLHFFRSVSLQLEPYLTLFQSNRPLFPLLFDSLMNVVKALMIRYIKTDVLAAANTTVKLTALQPGPSDFLRPPGIGFAASDALKKSSATKEQKIQFYVECRMFLSRTVEKILERSPMKYRMVRASSCLSPTLMLTQQKQCQERMQILLEELVETKWVKGDKADLVKAQFANLLSDTETSSKCREFKPAVSLLDKFFLELLQDKPDYVDLFSVAKLVLIFSHGNATVEAGFSINQDILVNNMCEESLIAQRLVYDAMITAGGPLKIELTPELMKSVRSSRRRYETALEERRSTDGLSHLQEQKKRRMASEKLSELAEKKRALETERAAVIGGLNKEMADLRQILNPD